MLNRHRKLDSYEDAQGGQWDRLPSLVLVCESDAVYTPRHVEESILYSVVAENLETFLAMQQQRKRTVPRFVAICSSLDGLIQSVEIYLRHLNNSLVMHDLLCLTRRLKKY
jgi:hypothetical protein